LVFCMIKVF